MSLKDEFVKAFRTTLNDVQDIVQEIDQNGGVKRLLDPFAAEFGVRDSSGKKTIRQCYANLEVDYGSDLDTVKRSYKTLMRKYHPDRFGDNPEMATLATELSQEITASYTAIEKYLATGRY